MGLAASQWRLIALTARKSDLEFTGQQINEKRLILADQVSQLHQMYMAMVQGYDFLNPTAEDQAKREEFEIKYNTQLAIFHEYDKMLELQLKRVDTLHQAIQTEIAAVQKVIQKNIEMSFKTFA